MVFQQIATQLTNLLDLIYLTPDADNADYIQTLRLQNLDQIDPQRLTAYAQRANKPKLSRALPHILQVIDEELTEYVSL